MKVNNFKKKKVKIRKIDGYVFFAVSHFGGHFEIKKCQIHKVFFFFTNIFHLLLALYVQIFRPISQKIKV